MSSALIENLSKFSPQYLNAIAGNSSEKIFGVQQLAQNHGGERKKVLDLGCGGGESSIELAMSTTAMVIAFDLSPESLSNISLDKENYFKVAGDGVKLPFSSDSLDCVNGSAVLHEIFSYAGSRFAVDQSLDEISRVLKPGGVFFFRDIYVPEGLEFSKIITLNLDNPLFRFFYSVYAENNLLITQLRQSGKLTENSGEISLPTYAAADLLNHFVYFRNDAFIHFMSGFAPCPPDLAIDLQLQKLLTLKSTEAGRLIVSESSEQYIHISKEKLIERLRKRGLVFDSEKYAQREYYTNYLTQTNLPPLAGAKLFMNFRKVHDEQL